jgi:WD40 repeat protein
LPTAKAQLYEQPTLITDPGMHTAPIRAVDVDAAGRLAATGSDDKTVRVWSVADGKLLHTIRMPAGPGDIGKIFAVAMSPDGDLVAAGGWTERDKGTVIYLFEARTGKLVKRISGLPNVTEDLALSPDGRYLAAGVGSGGLRIYDRDRQWAEVFHDPDYGGAIYGITFAGDGRLATASYDRLIRLYDRDFKLSVPPRKAPGGDRPYRIVFSPDGATLAVGYADAPIVDLFDGHSLAPLPRPDVDGLGNGSLGQVMWSKDGKTLFAAGIYPPTAKLVVAWANAGHGERRALPAGAGNTVSALAALPDGSLLVSAQDPFLAVLKPDGKPRWVHPSPKADFRAKYAATFAVSSDGAMVDFGFDVRGKSPLRFDLRVLKLAPDPPADGRTIRAKQAGLAIEGWFDGLSPTLDGKSITLEPYEISRSLAVHPDGKRFVLGADWFLRAFDAKGHLLWRRAVPGAVWAVNITADGRLVVAAYGDGTIRWHRMDDGRELLALYVLADKQNWVAWTPEGFYGATPGAFGVLRWQVNRGFDAAADTVPVSAIARLRRPDALKFVLQEMETARALGIADIKAARREVQIATGSAKAPGARLHVLTIGVSDYGDKASDLRLNFAHRDAQDVASALVNTQGGGLYAEVMPTYLHDRTADKPGIFEALAAMERNMAKGAGQDLAVVMFSGHGTTIDGQFYLVPYGVDDGTPARLKSSVIPATEFQGEILKLAAHGRVLVLLDACRSAGLIGGKQGADMLRSVLAANNVTVLTSSKADKLSREDEKWGHGAFTKVLLDALSGSAAADIDGNRNGVISMTELTAYVEKHLSQLTGGDQQLGLDQRFQGDLFVAGL